MSKSVFPYQRVRSVVLETIGRGEWAVGSQIPPEVKLAEELGVHRLTVNRVLTELAREGMLARRRGAGTTVLKRRPSTPKSGLLTAGVSLIGLITGNSFDPSSNPYFGKIFERMRKRLRPHGIYFVSLGDAEEFFGSGLPAPVGEVAAVAMLGIPEDLKHLRSLEALGIPAIVIGMSEYAGPLAHVSTPDYEDAVRVAKRLLEFGHQQIVHVNAIPPMRLQSRLHGFLHACEQEGHAIPFRYIVEAKGLEIRHGREAMMEFLDRGLPFTAVFGASDNLALGAMAALAERGVAVPGDASVVGFDGVEAAIHSVPALTTMRVARGKLGERAADCLMALCKGGDLPEFESPLPARWIEGKTLGRRSR